MDAAEVISVFLEHLRAFKDRDNFVWLTFMEVHHILKMIPDISNQIENSIAAHRVTPWYDTENKRKSVEIEKNQSLVEIYENEIRRLDYFLNIIYEHLKRNYKEKELIVSLMSDHGQSFLTDDKSPLSLERTKVPWLIKGNGIKSGSSEELTENTDIFRSLIECNDLKGYTGKDEGNLPLALGGKKEKKFVLSQSIYPGQTYKAVIRDRFFDYKFHSTKQVSKEGIIPLALEENVRFRNKSKAEAVTKKNTAKFRKIIMTKISDWNKRIS